VNRRRRNIMAHPPLGRLVRLAPTHCRLGWFLWQHMLCVDRRQPGCEVVPIVGSFWYDFCISTVCVRDQSRSPLSLIFGVNMESRKNNAELSRLNDAREAKVPWRKWGPYLSERQWGTVREDYSQNGDAWNYFTHDHARSRAYRWGEDGLGGISDDKQRLCFALALWNGRDPILKERLFGLTNSEGNHGEDVKEYYFYLDSTPTGSVAKLVEKVKSVKIRRVEPQLTPARAAGAGG
jgi:hypothetical protein